MDTKFKRCGRFAQLAILFCLPVGPVHTQAAEAQPAEEPSRSETLLGAVDAKSLERWHDLLAQKPHMAGTPGDLEVIQHLVEAFEAMGLEVERHPVRTWIAKPIRARLAIAGDEPLELSIQEPALDNDPDTSDPALLIGWNAYSGSGAVEAEVVYANYGRLEDFKELAELGVDCTGKIVIARYGGNFRGYKAKFAEAAGAAGLIIYTDPADSGWGRGLPWPEGVWAGEESIQRGSIMTLPYAGDPLSPMVEAKPGAEFLSPEEVEFPSIPVQPVGWAAAAQILSRMEGESVSGKWQGGLPFRYRLEGGSKLRVQLEVEQERFFADTANVIGILRGSEEPERLVLIGSHHDAWGCGASDPTSGLITVLEAARILSQEVREHGPFRRSIAFAGWGAEEFGIIGSTEWVEADLNRAREDIVAYMNLDGAAGGIQLSASASPSLQSLITEIAAELPHPASDNESALDIWRGRGSHPGFDEMPRFGDLGGGSDHVGFLALGGVPCVGFNGGGSPGTAYHTNYDTRAWYRSAVGSDYAAAKLIAGGAILFATHLADAALLPLDMERTAPEVLRHLKNLSQRGRELGLFKTDKRQIVAGLARAEAAALQYGERAAEIAKRIQSASQAEDFDAQTLHAINELLMQLDRAWLDAEGLPDRPWFQNLFAAPDETSGYSSWMLPALRRAIEDRDRSALAREETRLLNVMSRLNQRLDELERILK